MIPMADMLKLTTLLVVLLFPCSGMAITVNDTDPDSGLARWQSQGHGLSLELIQLLPDFVRGVYEARGLPPDLGQEMADYCVFGGIVRNETQRALSYDMRLWRARTADGQRHELKTKLDWLAEWRRRGVHFGWSMMPTAQDFEVGDWGQGFVTMKLPRGTRFDLEYVWRQHGRKQTARLEGVVCADESPPAK